MPSLKDSDSLAPLYLAVFVAVLGFSLVAPFFPRYVMDLGASYTMLGFIVSIYGVVQLLTQIPIGRLSDQMGRKKIMLLGLATFSFLPLLYIYAQSVHSLLFIRALGGLGASAVWPIAMAMIVDQAEAKSRGAAMGWYNAAFFSALALGPLIGGVLYDFMGISAPFYYIGSAEGHEYPDLQVG
ncbi:MAG: MFS transporter, partial [Methanothrix sp.]